MAARDITLSNETDLGDTISSSYTTMCSCEIGSGKVAVAYVTSSGLYVRVGTLDGNTWTLGSALRLNTSSSCILNNQSSTFKISSDKFGVIYQVNNSYCRVIACSVSGTTITKGSDAQINTSTALAYCGGCYISDEKFGIFYTRGSSGANSIGVGTTSGTSITLGTTVQIESTRTISNVEGCTIDTDKIGLVYWTSDSVLRSNACTISDTTITMGTSINISASTTAYYLGVVKVASNKMVAVGYKAATSPYLFCYVISASGTDCTAASTNLPSGGSVNYLSLRNFTDKFILSYKDTTNGYSSLWAGDVSGTTVTWGSPVNLPQYQGGTTIAPITGVDNRYVAFYYNSSTYAGKLELADVSYPATFIPQIIFM